MKMSKGYIFSQRRGLKLRIGGKNKRKKEKEGLEGTWNGKEWLGMERRG